MKVEFRSAGLEVLSIRRIRKEEVLLVLKKGGDVLAFRKELVLAVKERAEISALVLTRCLEIRDLDETFEKEELVSALCLALGRPALDGSCRLFTRFVGVKAAVIWLAEVWSAACWSTSKSPDASGALSTAAGSVAVATLTGKIPVGGAAPRDT